MVEKKSYIRSYVDYRKRLDDNAVRAVAGALVHELFLDQPVPREKFAHVVHDTSIHLGKDPGRPILKLARQQHVHDFFQSGRLQLGTYAYFRQQEHDEVGDMTEGSFVLVGRSQSRTAFAEISGGFAHYALCCYAGHADEECAHRFGYDASFAITDVRAFANAVTAAQGAVDHTFGCCVYSEDKVVVGAVSDDFDFDTVSPRLLELANRAKYFVKPLRYSNQNEFRFVWRMHADVTGPLILTCPEAAQFCRQVV